MGKYIKLQLRTFNLYYLLFFILVYITASDETLAQEGLPGKIDRDSVIAAAREIIGFQTYCALITVDSSGLPQVRTMNPFPPEDDMTVWIATNSRSRKVQEIQNNPNVCLYYADHKQASGYVAINGKAVLVDDTEEKLKRKRDYWDHAFPDWKYLLLIKVIPQKLEVINYKYGMLNDSITWKSPSIEF